MFASMGAEALPTRARCELLVTGGTARKRTVMAGGTLSAQESSARFG